MSSLNFTTKVVGVTHDNRQAIIAKLKGNEPCRIEPEPSNPYDPNALAVKVATPDGIQHVGYIPRDLAARIAPLLDGENLMVKIEAITGGFETRDGDVAAYGLIIRVKAEDHLPDDPIAKYRREPESEELRKKYYAKGYPDDSDEFEE